MTVRSVRRSQIPSPLTDCALNPLVTATLAACGGIQSLEIVEIATPTAERRAVSRVFIWRGFVVED
jgi:hypothetical protein